MRRVIDVESYTHDRQAKALADDLLRRVGVPVDDVVELIIDDDEHGHAFVTVEQVVRPLEWHVGDDGEHRLRHVSSTFEL